MICMKKSANKLFLRIHSQFNSRLEKSYKWSLLKKYIRGSFNKEIKNRIFFLHIPKCGGTSLNNAIKKHFISNMRLKDSTFQLDIHALYKAKDVISMDPRQYNEYLLPYFMAEQHLKYIGGHFFWNGLAFKHFSDEWDFITILRDPVSRWFSHYFYNRYKESSFFKIYDDIYSYAFSDEGIQIGKTYVGHLTDLSDQMENTEEKLIEKAIKNLNSFKLVGCIEKIDRFVDRFGHLYNVKLKIDKKNVNPKTIAQQKNEISKEIFERVQFICRADQKIYQHALSLIG